MCAIKDLTEQEQKRLKASAFGLDRLILLLLFDTGLEIDDLIGLRVSDVDWEQGLLRAAGKDIVISPETLATLRNNLKDRPGQVYLLEGRCGKPITSKWKRCVLARLLRIVGNQD